MHLRKILAPKYAKTKKTVTSEELGAKRGFGEQKQGTTHVPLHSTSYKGVENHLNPLSSLTPGHSSILSPPKELHTSSQGANKETCYLFFLPSEKPK